MRTIQWRLLLTLEDEDRRMEGVSAVKDEVAQVLL